MKTKVEWDPSAILQIYNPDTHGWSCVGFTQHGRRCRRALSQAKRDELESLLEKLTAETPKDPARETKILWNINDESLCYDHWDDGDSGITVRDWTRALAKARSDREVGEEKSPVSIPGSNTAPVKKEPEDEQFIGAPEQPRGIKDRKILEARAPIPRSSLAPSGPLETFSLSFGKLDTPKETTRESPSERNNNAENAEKQLQEIERGIKILSLDCKKKIPQNSSLKATIELDRDRRETVEGSPSSAKPLARDSSWKWGSRTKGETSTYKVQPKEQRVHDSVFVFKCGGVAPENPGTADRPRS